MQVNSMEPFPKFSDLDRLFPMDLMLVSQITPFIFFLLQKRRASSMDLIDNVF